jgi:hypothetical protein
VASIRNFDISINNIHLHSYVDSIYPNEVEIKNTTECSTSASHCDLGILLKFDTSPANGKLMTRLYGKKKDDFNFSIINFPYLCNNIPFSLTYGVYISQLNRYSRACSTYDQFLIRCNQLTRKLMSQGFLQSRLRAAFRKFYTHYNDLVCHYNIPLRQMLSDVFHHS